VLTELPAITLSVETPLEDFGCARTEISTYAVLPHKWCDRGGQYLEPQREFTYFQEISGCRRVIITRHSPSKSFTLTGQKRARRIVFAALPSLLLAAVLGILNWSLPRIDPSLDLPFTRSIMQDNILYREINRGYLSPFFPAGSPLIPELKPTLIRKLRAPNSLRVLCLGESAMAGVPYGGCATIPALVRKQLRHLYGSTEIEVVNLGASAVNSNVIRALMPDFLSLNPDLVLVYTGHNEFYGPDGVGAPWLERHFPWLIPWKYRARQLPLVMALGRWVAGTRGSQSAGETNLMRQVSEGAQVDLHSKDAERVFRQFRANIGDIVRGFRSHGIPVILADISSNMMFPPFAPRPDAGRDTLLRSFNAGHLEEAAAVAARVLARDSGDAYALYWEGRLRLVAGDTAGARHLLEEARDNDLLKFRAPGRINEIIHRVGEEDSVPVLSVDSVFRASSPGGITDSALFCEHLHPTFAGYDLIARTFVREIISLHIVPAVPDPPATLLPFNADSLSVPWIDLGYGAFSLRALTSHWPFTEMPRRRDVLDTCQPWEREIVAELYTRKIGWSAACLQYAEKARKLQRTGPPVTALSALVEEYPATPLFRYGLATALEQEGKTEDAVAQYRRALALKPDFAQASIDFGILLVNVERYDEAGKELRAFLAAAPMDAADAGLRAAAYYELAVIAVNRDSTASALALLQESLQIAPSYPAALELRTQIQSGAR
jgi:lysophospholipase L1-like esterase